MSKTHRLRLRVTARGYKNTYERNGDMGLFDGKKIIIIGDRDGIPAPAIEKCLEGTAAEVIFAATECFV